MQSRSGRLVGDLDLRAEADQFVEGALLGGPGVDAGDHAHLAALQKELLKFLADHPNAGEPHEGTQEVNPVGTLDFERDLRADLQVLVPVDQQDAVTKRDAGSLPSLPVTTGHERRINLQKNLRARLDDPVALAIRRVSREDLQDAIGEVDLGAPTIIDRCRDAADSLQCAVVNVAREDVSQGGVVDCLPLNEPALCPGTLDAGPERLCDKCLVEAGRQVVSHAVQDRCVPAPHHARSGHIAR